MGWFESSKGSGLILGDDPLDVTHRFLKEIADLYQEGCERKPTLNEFVALLESGLKYSGSDCIADLETRAVTQVAIKTAKKKKDQVFRVGDIFAIPLDKDLFAFGRYMFDGGGGGMLVEVFRAHSPFKLFSPRILESGRLFGPIIAGLRYELKEWRWFVVASAENYRISDTDLKTEFSSPDPVGGWSASPFNSNEYRFITEEEAKRMEDNRLWGAEEIEDRIRKELGLPPRKSP